MGASLEGRGGDSGLRLGTGGLGDGDVDDNLKGYGSNGRPTTMTAHK